MTTEQFIAYAVQEDIGEGDHTSLACIAEDAEDKAILLVKEKGILAGVELAKGIFQHIDSTLNLNVLITDGSPVKEGDVAFQVSGRSRSILMAERLVLNCMQRMSGIATQTNEVVQLLKHTNTEVLDTRKTTPGIRFMEKWAVRIGGGKNHRMGLYDMIMIKDNHIDYAGGIEQAIKKTQDYLKTIKKKLSVEVEARNMKEVQAILAVGNVDRIMLDNFSYSEIKEAVALIDGRMETEASGGITLETVKKYAECGVDYVSMGALTHSVKSLDLSLKATRYAS